MPEDIASAHGTNQCTKLTGDPLSATRYHQQEHGGGINSWIYTYENQAPLAKSWVGCGLEIGVQLRGTWRLESQFRPKHEYASGQICRVSVGERYAHSYDGLREPGLQVGFIVCAEQFGADVELRFLGDAGLVDPGFTTFSEEFANSHHHGHSTITNEQVVGAVNDYVNRHCELVACRPLLIAKRELERYFIHDLSVEHLAGVGGLHPTTFLRQFKSAFGMTPIHYRIMFRANYASRLLWTCPELTVAQIAEASGFPNVSYFHRTFRRCFGMNASRARARFAA